MEYKDFTKEHHAHNLHLYQMDCMDLLKQTPDKYYNLCIVDPPYGIDHANKAGKMAGQQYGNAAAKKRNYKSKDWDTEIPPLEYFEELERVSKNQIIWGGNYFAHFLKPKSGWVFWDKDNGDNNFSDGELAYTSFDCGLRMKKITWNGMIQYDMKNKEERYHPTQKPVHLYKWLLKNYAKEGDKILDTHLGSCSIAIAVHEMNKVEKMNLTLTGCELDEDYYNQAMKRVENACLQISLL